LIASLTHGPAVRLRVSCLGTTPPERSRLASSRLYGENFRLAPTSDVCAVRTQSREATLSRQSPKRLDARYWAQKRTFARLRSQSWRRHFAPVSHMALDFPSPEFARLTTIARQVCSNRRFRPHYRLKKPVNITVRYCPIIFNLRGPASAPSGEPVPRD